MFKETINLIESMVKAMRSGAKIGATAIVAASLLSATQVHAADYTWAGSANLDADNIDGSSAVLTGGDTVTLTGDTTDANIDLVMTDSDFTTAGAVTFDLGAFSFVSGDITNIANATLNFTASTGGIDGVGTYTANTGSLGSYTQTGAAGTAVDIQDLAFASVSISATQAKDFTIAAASDLTIDGADFGADNTDADIKVVGSADDHHEFTLKNGAKLDLGNIAGDNGGGTAVALDFDAVIETGDVAVTGTLGAGTGSLDSVTFKASPTGTEADIATNFAAVLTAPVITASGSASLGGFTGTAALGAAGVNEVYTIATDTGVGTVLPEFKGQPTINLDPVDKVVSIPLGITLVNTQADGKIAAATLATTNETVMKNTSVTVENDVTIANYNTFADKFFVTGASGNTATFSVAASSDTLTLPQNKHTGVTYVIAPGSYAGLVIGDQNPGVSTNNMTIDTSTVLIDGITLSDNGTITLTGGGLNFDVITRVSGSQAVIDTTGLEIEGKYVVTNYNIGDLKTGGYSISSPLASGESNEAFVGRSQSAVMNTKQRFASMSTYGAMSAVATNSSSFATAHFEEKAHGPFTKVDGMIYQGNMVKSFNVGSTSLTAVAGVHTASIDSGIIHADSRVVSLGLAMDVLGAKVGLLGTHEGFIAGKEQKDGFLGGSGATSGDGVALFAAKAGAVNEKLDYMVGATFATSKLDPIVIGPLHWAKQTTSILASQLGLEYKFGSGFSLCGYGSTQVVVKGDTHKVDAYSATDSTDVTYAGIDFKHDSAASWAAGIEAAYTTKSGLKASFIGKAGSGKFTAYGIKLSGSM